jgi:hypothetical protein
MIAPTAPMTAQYGDNAPAGSLGSKNQKLSGNPGCLTTSRMLISSDRPEKMVARIVIFASKIIVREMTNG